MVAADIDDAHELHCHECHAMNGSVAPDDAVGAAADVHDDAACTAADVHDDAVGSVRRSTEDLTVLHDLAASAPEASRSDDSALALLPDD